VKTQLRRRGERPGPKSLCSLQSLLHTYVHKLLYLSHVALKACSAASASECPFPHTKASPRVPKYCLLIAPPGSTPLPLYACRGPLWACFSIAEIHGETVKSQCRLSVETSSSKWDQSPAAVPKRCHKKMKSHFFGPSCVTLGCRCEKKCTWREPHHFIMF
jgi:hypothetical protein